MLYIGLMSGTSMDGIDAVLCRFDAHRFTRTLAHRSQPYPDALRSELLALQRRPQALTLADLCRLDNAVAQAFADCTHALLAQEGLLAQDICAIGSHGQTVFHDPSGVGSSVQLGNPNLIAAVTGIETVADFRRADIAQGGQGAPLVPAFHHAVFAAAGETRGVLNIGGIANLSVLPGVDAGAVRGFDTGPGNGLMDEWIERHTQQRYDNNGGWARSGTVHSDLLNALMEDNYFAAPAPKSTGRHHFNLDWVQQRYTALSVLAPVDVQRTLCELTARSIAEAVARGQRLDRLMLCGGGARNGFLRERLQALLPDVALSTTDEHGLASGDVEAAAFAWLALRCQHGWPGNLPAVTGARRAVVLGGIYRASQPPDHSPA